VIFVIGAFWEAQQNCAIGDFTALLSNVTTVAYRTVTIEVSSGYAGTDKRWKQLEMFKKRL